MSVPIISLGGPNNERCLHPACVPGPERPGAEVMRDLRAARGAGAARVLLAGGEPTLRRDLGAVVRAARELGLGVGLLSNGRRLLYPRLRRALLERGVDHFRLLLHAGSAAPHDAMVGVDGAFSQSSGALRGLLNEAGEGALVEVACVVTAENLDQLQALAGLVARAPRNARAGLRFVAPAAQAPGSAAAVADALDQAASMDPKLELAWEGFAPASLPGHAHLNDGAAVSAADGPPEGGTPNSFNFEHQRDLTPFAIRAGKCSAEALRLDDPQRHLLLQTGDGAALYRTPTRDFSLEELHQAREETEQLYLDISQSAAITELVRHVRRVRAHPECGGCPRRQGCCGAVVRQPGNPFLAEERWLRETLEELRGRVLDVGCGEQPYRALLGGLVRRGTVEYHGLDPDAGALERLRQSGELPGTFHAGTVEEMAGVEGPFDHVLALRAVNHFADLPRALEVMAAALRPGGAMLLSDMNVYGLLRTPAQVRHADARGGGHQQHFRNWSSRQVIALLEGASLRVVTHRPVTRDTSNEWFLLLERRR